MAKRGRKPKFSDDEVEARVRASALEMLLAEGVVGGQDAIRLDRVIQDSGVPRGAAYDLCDTWGSDTPQENLRRAVVIDVLTQMPAGNVGPTRDYAIGVIAELEDQIASATAEELRVLQAEVIRQVAGFNFGMLQDQRWRVYRALASKVGTQPDSEFANAVVTGEERLLAAYGELFTDLAAMFRLRLREDFEMEHFTISVYALNEGLSNRLSPSFAHQTVERSGAEWSVFAIGFDALVNQFFVPISQD